jgi:hypothetical protein
MKNIKAIQKRVSDICIYNNAEQMKQRNYGSLAKHFEHKGYSIIGLNGDNDLYIPYVKKKRTAKKIASRAFGEVFKEKMLNRSRRKKMRRCDYVHKIVSSY